MSYLQSITEGDVFYLRCTLCTPPKQKYFVVVQADPLRMFLVNSAINDYKAARPEHVAAMAPMRVADHPWMDHDSYIACDHLSHEYSYDRVMALAAADPAIFCGHLHPNAKAVLTDALRGNELVPRKYLKEIRPLWGLPR